MKASTVAALERINRLFYSRRACEFSDSRKHPWPGWRKVLALARESLAPGRISILDLGCGNGRFLRELGRDRENGDGDIAYLGIDSSLPLLALAARGSAPVSGVAPRFIAADLVHTPVAPLALVAEPVPLAPRAPLAPLALTAGFDLIVNFGLMHHVPSRAARKRLLVESASRLEAGGVLAVSFWQFGDKERFKRRILPWQEVGTLDASDLEAGDYLLAWGDSGAARYCHFADSEEAEELVGELGLDLLSSFRDDGGSSDLNLYYVLRKPAGYHGLLAR